MSQIDFEDRIKDATRKAKAFLSSYFKLDSHDIDDVVQEAAVKASQNIDRFKGESDFDTWFISIAKHEALAWLRKNKRHHPAEAPLEHEPWESPEIDSKTRREACVSLVRKAMEELGEKHRQVIEIVLEQSPSSKQLSDMLQIPLSSARTRLFYAKRRLKKIIQNAYQRDLQSTQD